jgi:hypothetical protein
MAEPSSFSSSGFNIGVLFADVPPEVLADEAEDEVRRAMLPAADPWHEFVRRVLPASEARSATEAARDLLRDGGEVAALGRANVMRRTALAGGDVRRARFWADVAATIARGEAS